MATIQITNVKKRYHSQLALDDVSLTIQEGEFFGLLDPNDNGRRQDYLDLDDCPDLKRPDFGSVMIHGHTVVSDYRTARRNLGVVPQDLVFDPCFTVRQIFRM